MMEIREKKRQCAIASSSIFGFGGWRLEFGVGGGRLANDRDGRVGKHGKFRE